MRSHRMFFSFAIGLLGLGCGFSQQEWEQRTRELTAAQAQADTLRQSGQSCGADLKSAQASLAELQSDLAKAGLTPEGLSSQLQRAKRALQEFDTREGQIAEQRGRERRWSRVLGPLSAAGVAVSTQDNLLQIQIPRGLLMKGSIASDPTAREVLARVATATLPDVEAGRRIQLSVQVRSGDRAAWTSAARRAHGILGALRAMSSGQLPAERFEVVIGAGGRSAAEFGSAGLYVRFVLLPTEQETLPLRLSAGLSGARP